MGHSGNVLHVLGRGVGSFTKVHSHGSGVGGGTLLGASGGRLHLMGDDSSLLVLVATGASEGGGGAGAVLGPAKGGLAVLVPQCGHIFLRLAGGVLLTVKAHSGGVGGHALLGTSGLLGHRRGSLSGGSLLVAAVLPVTGEGSGDAGVAFSPGKGRLAVGMRLKHRGNGHVALGHGEGVVGNFYGIALHLPLHKVVALAGNRSQGHGVPSSSGGVVGSSRAALHRAGHGDGVCSLGQGDLQLIQLGRLGVRAGEHQGAGSGLCNHHVKGDGMGLRCIVRGTSHDCTILNIGTAPDQLIGARAAAVESLYQVSTRHGGIVIEGDGVLLVQAVDILAVAGPVGLGHLEGPLAVGVQHLVVQLGKLRLQGGGDTALSGEHKGIVGGVLIPLHQVSLGSLNGLLGCGQILGGGISLSQYGLGVGNGLRVFTPAALVPLTQLAIGLTDQSPDLLFGHFRSGNHRTGAADLL